MRAAFSILSLCFIFLSSPPFIHFVSVSPLSIKEWHPLQPPNVVLKRKNKGRYMEPANRAHCFQKNKPQSFSSQTTRDNHAYAMEKDEDLCGPRVHVRLSFGVLRDRALSPASSTPHGLTGRPTVSVCAFAQACIRQWRRQRDGAMPAFR